MKRVAALVVSTLSLLVAAAAPAVDADARPEAPPILTRARAGTLDRLTFNPPDGYVTTEVRGDSGIAGIATQGFGRVLAGGASDGSFVLLRYHFNGSVDTTFGRDGAAFTEVGALAAGGEVLLQGEFPLTADLVQVGNNEQRFVATRLTAHGRLDRTFGFDGRSAIDVGETPQLNGGVIQPDGKILVVGSAGNPFEGTEALIVARFDADGGPDDTFGDGDGFVTVRPDGRNAIGFDVTVDHDGRIVATGLTTNAQDANELLTLRLEPDGQLDASFAGTGYASISLGPDAAGLAVLVQPDAKILVGGTGVADDRGGWVIARYNPDGTLDTDGFGGGMGYVAVGPVLPTQVAGQVRDLGLQRDGKIVATGSYGQSLAQSSFHVARLAADGVPDATFGLEGFTRTDIGSFSVPESLAVLPGGRIVAAGSANVGGSFQFAVARYLG